MLQFGAYIPIVDLQFGFSMIATAVEKRGMPAVAYHLMPSRTLVSRVSYQLSWNTAVMNNLE
jgi:hypothetical protein